MGCQRVTRIILLILSLVVIFAGVAILGAGLFQPYWQHVDMRGNVGIDSYWFGMYEDCMHQTGTGAATGWVCYYKWIQHKSDTVQLQLMEENWRLATFALLATAETCGTLAIFLGICACCNRFVSLGKSILTFLGGFLAAVALVLFYRNAHDASNEIYVYNGQTFRVYIGESFYLAIGGAIAFILGSFLSFGSSALFIMEVKANGNGSGMATRRTYAGGVQMAKSHESTI